jgi:TolB-like protein/Tfp pilus assembly protein PilF
MSEEWTASGARDKLKGVEKGFYNPCTQLIINDILRAMPPEGSNEQAVRNELERVLSSAPFSRNERLSRFLRFVVERRLEGKDSELKESLIAVEVFGRKPDYDPKEDAIVRTEAMRLRARLSRYYAEEGSTDPVVIELPKGGYTPVFRRPEATEQRPSSPRRVWLRVALAGLAIALGGTGWWLARHKSVPTVIAVLPLENLSRDPANDYFADGITDEIIRHLSVIEGLAVRSRTSSFVFKGKPQNIREVARLLEADYVLEGSVLRIGEQLRVNAQFVRVRDEFPLWSGKFDRELTDVFAIQDEISRGIVNQLRLKIGRGRRRYETSVEAYDLYLHARALPVQRGPRPEETIRQFEQVIAKDPSFAPAYAGLASAYAIRSVQFPLDHPPDESSKMLAAADKAIQLDPLLAEAHDALGLVYARENQWERSEKSFRHAIQLDPNRSTTYTHFALWFLTVLGRIDEALEQLRLAEKADPLSPEVHNALAFALILNSQFDEAARYAEKVPADHTFKKSNLARAWIGRRKFKEAIELLADDPPRNSAGFLGYAFARAGRRAEAEKLAATLVSPFQQALIFAGLGDKDRTIEALDRMTNLGALRLGRTLHYPELALVRGDPRLKALRKKVGLPE